MISKVQRALEAMAPELDSYRNRKIFSTSQINKIVENRRRFENKIQRSAKRISDFIEYVHSEIRLEKLRNKRISELGMEIEESDSILQSNIFKIYENAMHCFNEPILVKEFSEYCIRKKAGTKMKNVFATRCLKNLKDSDLWIYCAQQLWLIEDLEGARSLFMKAISVNQDPRIYIEFFRFECLFAQKLNAINQELGVDEDDKDDIEKGEIAFIVLQDIIKKFGSTFKETCLEITREIPEFEEKTKQLFKASTI